MRSDKRGQNIDPLAFKATAVRCWTEWPGPCPVRPSVIATFPHGCRMMEGHAKSPNTRHMCDCGASHMNKEQKK